MNHGLKRCLFLGPLTKRQLLTPPLTRTLPHTACKEKSRGRAGGLTEKLISVLYIEGPIDSRGKVSHSRTLSIPPVPFPNQISQSEQRQAKRRNTAAARNAMQIRSDPLCVCSQPKPRGERRRTHMMTCRQPRPSSASLLPPPPTQTQVSFPTPHLLSIDTRAKKISLFLKDSPSTSPARENYLIICVV